VFDADLFYLCVVEVEVLAHHLLRETCRRHLLSVIRGVAL
jgi:hypothetical protein